MTAKERAQIERVQMNELTPEYRVTTRLEEVAQGLTKEQAVLESQRCLNCKNPGCMEGCPVGIHIPAFIAQIQEEHFDEAIRIITEESGTHFDPEVVDAFVKNRETVEQIMKTKFED